LFLLSRVRGKAPVSIYLRIPRALFKRTHRRKRPRPREPVQL